MRSAALIVFLGSALLGCDDESGASAEPMGGTPGEDATAMADGGPLDAADEEDVAVDVDAGLAPDAAVVPDEGLPPDPPTASPTWVDCHVAWRGDTLDDAQTARCDALHRAPPAERIYGVRFVFLADVGDQMDWILPRLEAANEIYAPADISFTTAAALEIADGTVEILTGDQELTLGDRIQDLRGHLEMADASMEALLAALHARLLASGAAAEAVETLTADAVYTERNFLYLMARAHPEDLYLVVGDRVADRDGVGGQASPPFHPIATLDRSFVSISAMGPKATVPGHELGHYFGLRHPHALGRGGNPHLFAQRRTVRDYRASETHGLFAVLEDHLGEGLDGPVGAPYVSYDATEDEIADFEALRFALMDSWVRWRMSYEGDRVPFATFADFIAAWRDNDDIGLSNYMARDEDRQINNCTWQQDEGVFACTYPDSDAPLGADHPLLDGYILYDDGTRANVMSYIRQPGRDSPPRGYGVFREQIDVLHVSANSPQRLSLRNHAQ